MLSSLKSAKRVQYVIFLNKKQDKLRHAGKYDLYNGLLIVQTGCKVCEFKQTAVHFFICNYSKTATCFFSFSINQFVVLYG
jgi:hypothetical protein